jgi:hypothetical protein
MGRCVQAIPADNLLAGLIVFMINTIYNSILPEEMQRNPAVLFGE